MTAQTDLVGKISRAERYVFYGLKIMQMCGESVGVKVKRLFVLELLLECSATQEKTIVDQLVICLFSRIIIALCFNFKSF